MAAFRFILLFGYLVVTVFSQSPDSPPPSVIGQRNPNAIKSSTSEEPEVRNPGVPVASLGTTTYSEPPVTPTESSPTPTTATTEAGSDATADYTPLGQTGAGITLEAAWNTLLESSPPNKQPDPMPEPVSKKPQTQADPFDIFGPPSNNMFGMGPSDAGIGGQGPDMGFGGGMGGMPLAALALMGGGEGLGGMSGMNMMRLMGGPSGGLLGRLGGGQGGFGSGPGSAQMDMMRTMLLMQVLGLGGDAPDPPPRGKGKPGAPGGRQISPLEQLMRLERIRMLRGQQVDRAMRNRNAPQNQGGNSEFRGRPRMGPGGPPSRFSRQGQGRGKRRLPPTEPSPYADMDAPTPVDGMSGPQSGNAGSGGLSSADAALRDKILQMLGQMGFGPNMNNASPSGPSKPSRSMGQRPRGRRPPFRRGGPSFPPSEMAPTSSPGESSSTGEMGPYWGGEMGPTSSSGEMGPPYPSGEMGSSGSGEFGPSGSGEFGPSGSGETGASGEMSPPYPSGEMAPSGEMRPSTNMRRNMLSDTHFQRSMRVGSRPRPSAAGPSGANTADTRADRADMMADYMDNMQAMNPIQRLLGGGGMPGMGAPGLGMLGGGAGLGMGGAGGLSPLAGLLGGGGGGSGLGNLGLATALLG